MVLVVGSQVLDLFVEPLHRLLMLLLFLGQLTSKVLNPNRLLQHFFVELPQLLLNVLVSLSPGCHHPTGPRSFQFPLTVQVLDFPLVLVLQLHDLLVEGVDLPSVQLQFPLVAHFECVYLVLLELYLGVVSLDRRPHLGDLLEEELDLVGMVALQELHFLLTQLTELVLDHLQVLLSRGLVLVELSLQRVDSPAVGVGLGLVGGLHLGVGFDQSLELLVLRENGLSEPLVLGVEGVVLDGELLDGRLKAADGTAPVCHLMLKIIINYLCLSRNSQAK